MAHKTLVGGTAYNISGGKSMVDGSVYNIKSGRTLIDGTGYDIIFSKPKTALLYSDGSFVFQEGDDVEDGKILAASYIDFENDSYGKSPRWNGKQGMFKNVDFRTEIVPKSICGWFNYSSNMVANIDNFTNLNMKKVIYMNNAYTNCRNLTGSPVCGENVINMVYAYYGCVNLTGSPACGENVINMEYAYAYCNNITGYPVCGENVTNMYMTYTSCYNLTGSPVCGEKVSNIAHAYSFCNNITGSPVCGENVTNMNMTYYNCCNLTGSPVCGEKVSDMSRTYYNCYSLTGSPVCGEKVSNMDMTYYHCRNLTGSPVCGENVTNMSNAYKSCYNLTGSPVCGEKVTVMSRTYDSCYNLTGSPVCGENVTNMSGAYSSCYNLTGSPVCGENVTSMYMTYYNCYNLTGNAYFYSANISDMGSCFHARPTTKRLNLYLPANSTSLTTALINNNYSMTGFSTTWTNDMVANKCYYNTYYNIYIYPVYNVESVMLENEFDEILQPSGYEHNYTEFNENSIFVKNTWIYELSEVAIDSGKAYTMPIILSDLNNIIIESMEVK